MVDIRKSTIDELATLLGGGGLSAVELLNSYIEAIQSEDENYNAIAFLNPDAQKIALELDNERRNGFVRGPLHGMKKKTVCLLSLCLCMILTDSNSLNYLLIWQALVG